MHSSAEGLFFKNKLIFPIKYPPNSVYKINTRKIFTFAKCNNFFRIKKTNVSKINEKVNHFVGLFDELHTTSIVKNSNDFCYFLSRTDVVIDLFQSYETKSCPLYQTITDQHFYFIDQFIIRSIKLVGFYDVISRYSLYPRKRVGCRYYRG